MALFSRVAGSVLLAILLCLCINFSALARRPGRCVLTGADNKYTVCGRKSDVATLSFNELYRIIKKTNRVKGIKTISLTIKHVLVEEPLDFQYTGLSFSINFDSCIFSSDVFFSESRSEQSLSFTHCVFKGKANFSGVTAKNIDFSNSVFRDLVDLRRMLISNRGNFQGAHFIGKALFDFSAIVSQADFRNCKFHDHAGFYQCKLGSAYFSNSFFYGDAEFDVSVFTTCLLNNCCFNKAVGFNSAQVEYVFDISNSTFFDEIDFKNLKVADELKAYNVEFISGKTVNFKDARINNFLCKNTRINYGRLSFLHATVPLFSLDSCDIQKLDLSALNCSVELSIANTRVHSLLLLNNVVSGHLKLSPDCYARVAADSFQLDGLKYQNLELCNCIRPETSNIYADFVDRSKFNLSSYITLESFFNQNGYKDFADEIYIRGKRKEASGKKSAFIENFLDVAVGYGRHPLRAFGWSFIIIIFGCFVFRNKENMELQEPTKHTSENYSAFWYSVDLFVPVADLTAKSIWRAKPEYTFGRIYMQFHIILGWILIPLGLAYFSGLIK
jgi:uncharacterized protein YjbI with pentapeptide repeats